MLDIPLLVKESLPIVVESLRYYFLCFFLKTNTNISLGTQFRDDAQYNREI